MKNLKEEYNHIIEQRRNVVAEMQLLGKIEEVKRYLELEKQNQSLYDQQLRLYRDVKMQEYSSCNHILVYSQIDYDRYEGRTHTSCGCIKCGLDNSVLNGSRDWLTGTQKIMYDYLKKNYLSSNFGGIQTEVICDIDLAQAIYDKIKSVHPDIDDETAVSYFEIALDHIRNIKVSDERKANRAKRLSLDSSFQAWDSKSVYHDE